MTGAKMTLIIQYINLLFHFATRQAYKYRLYYQDYSTRNSGLEAVEKGFNDNSPFCKIFCFCDTTASIIKQYTHLEIIYLYFPPFFHLTVVVSVL